MTRIDKLQKFLDDMNTYYSDINTIAKGLPDISKYFQGILFANTKDIQLWQDNIKHLLDCMERMRCSYKDAGLGELPSEPKEASIRAEAVLEKLMSRQKYILAVNFVKGLNSCDEQINKRLAQLKLELPHIDLEQTEDENVLSSLDIYVHLHNAFKAKERSTRFAELLKVGASLDSELLYTVFELPEVFSVDIPSKSEVKESPTHRPKAKANPTAKAIPEKELIQKQSKPVKQYTIDAVKTVVTEMLQETKELQTVNSKVVPPENITAKLPQTQAVSLTEAIADPAEEVDQTEQLKRAFAYQQPTAIIKTVPLKKEVSSYTINKFKVEAKGENDSAISLIYRLIDKYGYVSLESPDIPEELKPELESVLDNQRKRGYLIKIVVPNRTTFYYLAVKGSQAIKDSAFRNFVRLGKNLKRADIHTLREFNDFNVTNYVQLRDHIRSVGINAATYTEKETVYKNCYTLCYEAKENNKPNVKVIGFTEVNPANFNLMNVRLQNIVTEKDIIILAGLNAEVLLAVMKWAKENMDSDIYNKQLFVYNASDMLFNNPAFDEDIASFQNIYDKYLVILKAEEKAIKEKVVSEAPAELRQEINEIDEKIIGKEAVERDITVSDDETGTVSKAIKEEASDGIANEEVTSTDEQVKENADEVTSVPEGILLPSEICEAAETLVPAITAFPNKENKNSSPKEFKRLVLQSKIRGAVFSTGMHGYYIHPEIVSGYSEMPLKSCVFELDQLVTMGLLRKVQFDGMESYYILTPKAVKLCKSDSITSLLNLNIRKPEPQDVYANTKLLNVKYYLNALKYITEATHYHKSIMKCKIAPNYFIHLNKPCNEVINYACISGVFTDSENDFELYVNALEELQDSIFVMVFVAASPEQGKALLDWWMKKYPGFNKDALGYMLVDDKSVYTVKEDEIYSSYDAFFLALLDKMEKEIKEMESEQVDEKSESKKNLTPSPNKKKPKTVQSAQVPVSEVQEAEPVNIVLDKPTKENYLKNYSYMVGKGKTYAACAYLKVLSEKDKSLIPLYKQLAYATGDPLGGCTYTSQVISEVFFSDENCDNYLLTAASLRNFFYDFYCYDYYINQLMDMLKTSSLVQNCQSLAILLQDMADFKKNFNSGLDRYADYHVAGSVDIDKELTTLKYYISEQYNHYCVKFKEDIANKRFSEARKIVLEKEGPLGSFLRKAMEGDESAETLAQLRSFLTENYIVEGAMVRKENIDNNKIESVIDAAWNKAAEKLNSVIKTSDLMSALRTKFFNQIYRLVTPLCDYIALQDAKIPVDNPEASKNYTKLRSRLLHNIDATKKYAGKAYIDGENTALVLVDTLCALEACLNGTYKAGYEKYFYLDFLKTDNVLLDDNFMPYLNEVDGDLQSMSVLRRIEKHLSTKEEALETRAQKILDNEDNYSSLKCILTFLETVNPGYEAKFIKEKSLKLSLENAAAELDIYREEFENDIELRQSYGQIDETEGNPKEKLLKIVDFWYEWAKESQNYGFFHKICEALIEKIENDAVPRGKQLQGRLDKFVRENTQRLEDELVEEAVATIKERIRIKNYAAAEDLLNRLYSDDDTLIPAKSVIETDYLQNFIRDYNACYQDVCSMRTNFKSLLSGRATNNKDGKAANRLLESWMYRPELCSEERVNSLLTSLDFAVGSVTELNKIGNAKIFDITLARPQDGRKVKHKHPIAAFGSMAETDPFRAVFIFGNYEAEGLLDIFNSLGDAKHTLVFMDGALTMSARRTLARKTKEVSGKTFAVVDRVVLAFLHRNYRQSAVQKMLMSIIIPFAFCQPYVVDSFVMAPEIFIGREEELKQIESPDGVNIVYGGRQLGKSAMLRMAVNDVDRNERGDRAVFVDIANLDYKAACHKVSMVLNEDGILAENDYTDDWSELSHRLRVRLKSEENRIPYLLLLLDEADEFIRTAAEVNYSPLENLKDVQGIGVGRFKFVFAGLRDVIRFDRNQALSNNSIMTKLSKLTVKPFNVNEARLLLEQPLGYLGLRFAKDEETESLIASIFSATNYFPGLLQLYCANLVKALQKPDYAGYDEIDTPPYEVSVEHIKKVLGGKELQTQIRDKFFITLQLGENEDKYYYIIAHLIALQHHRDAENSDVTPQMVLDLAAEYAIKRITDLDEQKVYALMEELCELNILHIAGKGYRFTRYSFYQMMGSVEHIENELLQFLED